MPYLLAWDGTLRLVASEARIRRAFRPGFVLDDGVVGEAIERPGPRRFIFIHPDRFAQVVKAHRERPLAIAAFLHGIAVHELTHLDGRMGLGHDESFVAAREDLGAATAHLLPAIAVLVSKLLRLPEAPSEDARRAAKLERQLDQARRSVKEQRAKIAALERERERLRGAAPFVARGGLDAERLLDAAAAALRANPPAGVDTEYVDAFLERRQRELVGVVRRAFAR